MEDGVSKITGKAQERQVKFRCVIKMNGSSKGKTGEEQAGQKKDGWNK